MLVDNVHWLKGKGITFDMILCDVIPVHSGEEGEDYKKLKRGFQKGVLKTLKAALIPNATERIRNKVERWRGIPFGLTGLPGQYAPAIGRRLQKFGTLVNPRVHADFFHLFGIGG